jgi:hypothetical protein
MSSKIEILWCVIRKTKSRNNCLANLEHFHLTAMFITQAGPCPSENAEDTENQDFFGGEELLIILCSTNNGLAGYLPIAAKIHRLSRQFW